LAESLLDLDGFQWQRVQVLAGDAAHANLGLSFDQYSVFAKTVNIVVNAASKVDYVSGYAKCAPANVHAVKESLAFCTFEQLKVYHHTSTTSVLPLLHKNRSKSRKHEFATAKSHHLIQLDEGFSFVEAPTAAQLQDSSGYVASKAVAEHLCQEARMKGVPTIIHRVGMIGPAASTGACQRDNFVTRIFASALQLEKFPCDVCSATPLTLNPVDYVATGIVSFVTRSFDSALAGSLLCSHFSNSSRSIAFASAWSWFKGTRDSQLQPIPYMQWAKLCSGRTSALTPLLGSLDKSRMNRIGSAVRDVQTQECLKHLSVGNLPKCDISEAYFQRMHTYLKSRLALWYAAEPDHVGTEQCESADRDPSAMLC